MEVAIQVKERPLPLGQDQVRAVLDGRKTQHRLPLLGACDNTDRFQLYSETYGYWGAVFDKPQNRRPNSRFPNGVIELGKRKCPLGKIGDRIYVKETWQIHDGDILYRSDDVAGHIDSGWRPSTNMTKDHSRIWLEVASVRVERVQDITIGDIMAEGLSINKGWDSMDVVFAKWIELWDSINKKRGFGWDANPWVWVVEFKRMDP